MKSSFFKKLISLAAACVMTLSVLPISANAAIDDRDTVYSISTHRSSHAYIYTDTNNAYEGDLIDLNIAVDEGYMVDTIDILWYDHGYSRHTYLYEEDRVGSVSDDEGVWQFEMPASNVEISVSLAKDWRDSQIEIKIEDKENNHGDVYSSRYFPYYGEEITLTAIPDDGYTVEYIKVNGDELTPVEENYGGETEFLYTVDRSNVRVTVSFVRMDKSTYSVSYNALNGGRAYLNATAARAGDNVTLTVTPDEGMVVDTVKYDDTVLEGEDNIYVFTMPPHNVKLSITFKSDGTTTEPSNPSTPTWVQDGNTWKILNTDGTYINGWYKMKNQWYYMDAAGNMFTGWLQLGNTWYYLKDWGGMATGWLKLGNTWYYLKDWGGMATGWLKLGNTWYYLKDWGGMATGWNWINGKCYYFYSSGAMAANTTVNGYRVNASGAWIQ